MARAGLESVAKRERAKRRITTGAATRDDQAIGIDFTAIGEIASAVNAVVNIDDAPLLVESLSILPSVTGTAAIVDIEHGEPAAGPILNRQTQGRRSRSGWSTMTLHDQWRLFVVGRTKVRILW